MRGGQGQLLAYYLFMALVVGVAAIKGEDEDDDDEEEEIGERTSPIW